MCRSFRRSGSGGRWFGRRLKGMGGPKARLSIDESVPRLVATIEAQAGKGERQFLDYTGVVGPW